MGTIRYEIAAGLAVDLIDDCRVCGKIKAEGSFERDTLKAWASMCVAGCTVIDVGSYNGMFAIIAAKLGCRAIAIEPMPVLCRRIGDNAALNGVSISLHHAAASDKPGTERIGYNPQVYLTAGASFSRKEGESFEVTTITIDTIAFGRDVCAMKIDTERAEMKVLAGATATIARNKPPLLIEALTDHQKQKVCDWLPDYELAGVLDVRNLHLEPRNGRTF